MTKEDTDWLYITTYDFMPMLRGKHSEESEKQGNKDAAKEADSHIASIARKLDELLKGKEEMDEKLDLLVQSKKEQDTRLNRVLQRLNCCLRK